MAYFYRRKENGVYYAAIERIRTLKTSGNKKLEKPRYVWKIISLHTRNRSEAKEIFAGLVSSKKIAKAKNIVKEITLTDYFRKVYLDEREFFSLRKHSSKDTYKETKYILEKFLRYLNDDLLLLTELTEEKVEKYKRTRMGEKTRFGGDVQNSTVNREIIAIKGALTYAVKKKLLTESPAKNVEVLPTPTQSNIKYLEQSEIRQFLLICQRFFNSYYPLFLFYIATGCRRSEGTNLTWDDVDFENNIITIQSKKEDNQTGVSEWNPKDCERREIRAHPSLFNVLQKLKNKTIGNPYVFSFKEKGRINEDWLSRLFRKILQKAKIKSNVPLHALRHSYAIWNLKTGNVRSLEALRQLLGHASYKTTQIYTRFASKEIQESVSKFKFW